MFVGTTETLMENPEDVCITQETTLAELLRQYESTLEDPHGVPDQAILNKALSVFQQRLQERGLHAELVHLGTIMYYHLQEYHALFVLLEEYRRQPLSVYEQAWVWWYCVDCLALQGKHERTVEEQQRLLGWALEHFPAEHCLFAFNDNTQAMSWLMIKKADQWLVQAESLLQAVLPTAASRYDRFLLLRSILDVLIRVGRKQQAQTLIPQLQNLEHEDQQWSRNDELHLEITALHIQALTLECELHLPVIRSLAQSAIRHLHRLRAQFPCPTMIQRRMIRRLAHNVGSKLYFAHQYDVAIPLFEIAIDYGSTSPHTYLWLAASMWVTLREMDRVVLLLRQALEHDGSQSFKNIYQVAEFGDEAPTLVAALTSMKSVNP